MNFTNNLEEAKKIDNLRNKMLKYIIYKKRSEAEVRQKFSEEDENLLDDAIEYFKDLKYKPHNKTKANTEITQIVFISTTDFELVI